MYPNFFLCLNTCRPSATLSGAQDIRDILVSFNVQGMKLLLAERRTAEERVHIPLPYSRSSIPREKSPEQHELSTCAPTQRAEAMRPKI
jgi:hypothetical protein